MLAENARNPNTRRSETKVVHSIRRALVEDGIEQVVACGQPFQPVKIADMLIGVPPVPQVIVQNTPSGRPGWRSRFIYEI